MACVPVKETAVCFDRVTAALCKECAPAQQDQTSDTIAHEQYITLHGKGPRPHDQQGHVIGLIKPPPGTDLQMYKYDPCLFDLRVRFAEPLH